MSNSNFTVEQFRTLAAKRFSFLEDKGFHRTPKLEETASTGGTVVYLGKNVGFVFSLDVRDQCVDGQVVKVHKGRMKHNWEGGYSSNLFSHLVKYSGYRGGLARSKKPSACETGDVVLQRMIDTWGQLLEEAGGSLLSDDPQSFPD
jgi:hypothetical protein